ncbi:hypothetical protein ACIQ6Y_31845 [Streptomyces sp. NPDC096205]|uniref:hypothetical protein n=1 Tax=Streptomyces sp. NPDC096205 TaxID=3366081 RepID=UPI003813F354
MSSGLSVNEDVVLEHKKLKEGKINYLLCKVADDSSAIVVDRSGNAGYYEFRDLLPGAAPRFALYNYEVTADAAKTTKTVLFVWQPEGAPAKAEQMYAAALPYFSAALDGIAIKLQVGDPSDLDQQSVESRLRFNR